MINNWYSFVNKIFGGMNPTNIMNITRCRGVQTFEIEIRWWKKKRLWISRSCSFSLFFSFTYRAKTLDPKFTWCRLHEGRIAVKTHVVLSYFRICEKLCQIAISLETGYHVDSVNGSKRDLFWPLALTLKQFKRGNTCWF